MSPEETQRALFDVMVAEMKDLKPTIAESFWEFHHEYPGVYEGLKTLALALKHTGRRRYGIAGIYEAMRYDAAVKGGEPFKLNNNYRALYARLLMSSEPELMGFFEIRTRTSAE